LVMEMALRGAGLAHDYALGDDQPSNPRVVPLLKLHGSVNWYLCEKCGVVYDGGTFRNAFQRMENGRFIATLEHPRAHSCSQVPARDIPVIVPPSWDKSRYQNSLRIVWARAAQELAVADEIYVIGYSLPETDAFFRYLFALGTQSRTRVHRLFVVNPDKDVRPKFERFIGQGLRPQLEFAINGTFESSLGEIDARLIET
jgi:NAD-dependent SIR2 family protein deacetylase